MRYESPYFHKSFRPYLIKRLAWPFIWILCLSILFSSSLFHQRKDYGYRYSDFEFFMDGIMGLQYYGLKEFLLTFGSFCFMLLLWGAIIYHDNKSCRMIVAIQEDFENKKLTFFIKDFLNKIKKISIPLRELKIESGGRQKDGLSKHGYLCYEFKRRNEVMGRYFINYYIWQDERIILELKNKLNPAVQTGLNADR